MSDQRLSPFRRSTARALVWGHRGTRPVAGRPGQVDKPQENTLAALALALDQGAEGVEIDVRLCKSGEVIVLHDADLQRVGGARLRVADATLAQLQAVDLGRGQRVPTLEAALELVLGRRPSARINVEIKVDAGEDARALVKAVARCLEARAPAEQRRTLISSFSQTAVRAAAERMPQLVVAYLFERAEHSTPPDEVSAVHPHHALLDGPRIASSHARGLLVNTWTVNDPDRARALSLAGVDGIITDDVPAVLAALGA